MNKLMSALETLEVFVRKAQKEADGDKVDYKGRDGTFLSMAKEAISDGSESALQDLLDEMRGLSHYFCSYAKDTETLDRLTGDLYSEVQNAIIASRSKGHGG